MREIGPFTYFGYQSDMLGELGCPRGGLSWFLPLSHTRCARLRSDLRVCFWAAPAHSSLSAARGQLGPGFPEPPAAGDGNRVFAVVLAELGLKWEESKCLKVESSTTKKRVDRCEKGHVGVCAVGFTRRMCLTIE